MRAPTLTVLALTALTIVAGPAGAVTAPANSELDYAVMRNGDKIGSHIVRFRRDGDTMDVDIQTNVEVKVLFVPVYHFRHSGQEVWKDGRLIRLESKTDDDGTAHQLKVHAENGHLAVVGDKKASTAAADIIPASLWNLDMVQGSKSVVLNTLDGHQMSIDVVQKGEEQVTGRSGPVKAEHYVVTGGLERELWYAADGDLVKVRFKGSDGSNIEYVLQ